jgi:hypothetical protein
MAYRQYQCLVSHYDGRFYKAGLTYLFTADPGARFALLQELNWPRNSAGVDLDGTWFPGVVGYDDWRFEATAGRQGALNKPDFDYTDIGYAMPQNDATEKLYFSQLSSHRMMTHPDVMWYPHLHYYQDEADLPTFYYQFRVTAAGAQAGALSAAVATTGEPVFTYANGKIHQILEFPPIRAQDLGFTGVAAMVDLIVYRQDNVVAGDVVFKEFDFHCPFDAPLGSGQQFIK